jgi:signal transduction histidine kinase
MDADILLNLIVYTAVQAIANATSGALYILDTDEEDLSAELPGTTDPGQAGAEESRLVALGRRVAREALNGAHVVDVADVAQDSRFAGMSSPSMHSSLLVAPLQVRGHSMGVLIIESQAPHAFTPADERFVMSLATSAAEAIEQRRLERQRDILFREWNRSLLSDMGRLLSGVAHELRNPLTAVIGYTQLLRTADGLGSTALRDLAKIQSQAQKAARIANNLSGFARHCRAGYAQVNLNELLQQTLALCAHVLGTEGIGLNVNLTSKDLQVVIDPSRLQQVFLRFINQARDVLACLPQGGELFITTELDGAKAVVRSTYGRTASPSHLAERAESASQAAGAQNGLELCTGIVEEYGGSIRCLDSDGGATTWIIELPTIQETEGAPVPY